MQERSYFHLYESQYHSNLQGYHQSLSGKEFIDHGEATPRGAGKERGRRELFETTRLDGEGLACGERACL